MKCPFCSDSESKVVDSRPTDEGSVIRRRRECTACAKRFTTYEKIEHLPVFVVKKDGRREPFDGEKLKAGLLKACEKRPVSVHDLEVIVQEVEREVSNALVSEITSQRMGR
jgi:transcriptional repressor NrdR